MQRTLQCSEASPLSSGVSHLAAASGIRIAKIDQSFLLPNIQRFAIDIPLYRRKRCRDKFAQRKGT